jgi:hypothetical protein
VDALIVSNQRKTLSGLARLLYRLSFKSFFHQASDLLAVELKTVLKLKEMDIR